MEVLCFFFSPFSNCQQHYSYSLGLLINKTYKLLSSVIEPQMTESYPTIKGRSIIAIEIGVFNGIRTFTF